MDYTTLFPDLPDTARVWTYVADRPLSASEQDELLARLRSFVEGWTSHGRTVHGHATVGDGRILILAATLDEGTISGCGIDASVQAINEASDALGITWTGALDVIYRDAGGRVQSCSRRAFRRQAEAGAVTAATPVFDPSVTTLGAMRQGAFEQPAAAAWHGQTFDLPQPA